MPSRGHVLLLVTGGIAAYKACVLTRLLRQAGFDVKVGMTDAAQRFVTPMTLSVLSENPVASDLWGEGQSHALDHVDYARWADLAVVAPATANILAKMAHGIADDIVSTLLLAHPGPVLVAPAMNDNMWVHPATQANVEALRARGVEMVAPEEGWLACGVVSTGRMAEPETIMAQIESMTIGLTAAAAEPADAGDYDWTGRRVTVTAGPTHEPVDPVRYVGNRSSGVFGYAIAREAARRGAEVTLITGPVALTAPEQVAEVHRVTTAGEMAAAVREALDDGCDWLVMAAAVADFTPRNPVRGKVKKDEMGDSWSLELIRTPDILAEIVAPRHRGGLKVVGFALETDDLLENARHKMAVKGLDFVVANGAGFGDRPHRVHLLGADGVIWHNEEPAPKDELAQALLTHLAAAASGSEPAKSSASDLRREAGA